MVSYGTRMPISWVEVLDNSHHTHHPNAALLASYTTLLFWPGKPPPQLYELCLPSNTYYRPFCLRLSFFSQKIDNSSGSAVSDSVGSVPALTASRQQQTDNLAKGQLCQLQFISKCMKMLSL